MEFDLQVLAAIGAGSLAAAALVVCVGLLLSRRPAVSHGGPAPLRLLLVDGRMADLPERSRRALDLPSSEDLGWSDLAEVLQTRFPDLPDDIPKDSTDFVAADGARLLVTVKARQTLVELRDDRADAADRQRAFRLQDEVDVLRAALDSAPDPIWHTRGDGTVVWGNPAYRAIQGDENLAFGASSAPKPGEVRRVRLNETEDRSGQWFDLRSVPRDEGTLNYAANVESVVQAEIAQRNFVQTLTKTFAHLPIGLAIFDRNRQLALFNPALIDLTALPAEFLSGRPTLMTFFDTLREARMMPEPKNYSSWREQLAELVRATCDDRYSETWTLPSGLTYKITGRPHPDGAIAFLIEDISAEISLTRRFRAELSQSQAALDAIDDGIVIFSHLGVLTMCNAAYRDSWGTDPEISFIDINIIDELRRWQAACGPSQVWSNLREHVMGRGNRECWSAEVSHMRLGHFTCHVVPITGGETLLRFEKSVAQAKELSPKRQAAGSVARVS